MYLDVCIVGGGAVGSVIAYFLYRSGLRNIPVYYGSQESVREVSKLGGVLVHDIKRGLVQLVPVQPRSVETPVDECFIVFNTVKAYDVESSLGLIDRILSYRGVLIMLQNGFGSLELAEDRFHGRAKVAGGVVYFGAERKARAEVYYHGGDTILVGCRREVCFELLELSRLLRPSGLELRLVEDIDYYRWLKLALNAVVNPITAITGSRNRILLEKEGVELARMILEEVCRAAEKRGYRLDLDRLMKYVERNIKSVADNVSSMLQDVIAGRKTEIDYINGHIAEVLGENAKINRALTLLLKLIEKRRLLNWFSQ